MLQSPRPDLVRGWLNYFLQKGEQPRAGGEIIPVVLMDDNSGAPYPGSSQWMAGDSVGAVAAQYSYLGILSTDPLQTHSAVVIDELIMVLGAAGVAVISLVLAGSLVLTDIGTVENRNMERELTFADRPRVGNAKLQQLNTVVALGGVQIPVGAQATPTTVKGPWVLGPGTQLLVRPNVVNTFFSCFFRGRYYGAY